RLLAFSDHVAIPDVLLFEEVDEWRTGHGEGRGLQEIPDLLEDGEQTARTEQVLHQVLARRLKGDQQGYSRTDAVRAVERRADAETTGDREQMHHRVRGSADGCERNDRVVEGLGRDDVTELAASECHLDCEAATRVRHLEQSAVWSRGSGDTRESRAER